MNAHRILIPEQWLHVPAGEKPGYPTDDAFWIWLPDDDGRSVTVADFILDAVLGGEPVILHVTADQRFDLFLDEERIASGPDAGHLMKWPFSSYRIELAPGPHRFRARVWWVGRHAPLARMTHRGGFLLKADPPHDNALSTGKAPWQVQRLYGWTFTRPELQAYIAVGDPQIFDAAAFAASPGAVPAAVLSPALHENQTGLIAEGWHLTPTTLPEQFRREIAPGRIRAVRKEWMAEGAIFEKQDETNPACAAWQALLSGTAPIILPAHSASTVLWDLDDYYCGWPHLTVAGGRGAEIECGWCESLLRRPSRDKGPRDTIVGKQFHGMVDRYLLDGRDHHLEPLWWRAGRFFHLRIRTADEPLTLHALGLRETRYPFESASVFQCDDPAIAPIEQIAVRGLQMCSHEHFLDCPYYEQLMYVGDTRVETLLTYVLTHDDRLPRRAIRLFNDSRHGHGGWTAARFPCRDPQIIPPFSMFWIGMVRDYLMWRANPDFVREQLPGIRALLSEMERYEEPDGVPGRLPGWPFTDWVAGWPVGCAPNAVQGATATLALLYLIALQDAAFIERVVGDSVLARHRATRALRLRQSIVRRFWDPCVNLMADDPAHTSHSEHAQILAILAHALPPHERRSVTRAILEGTCRPRPTMYFEHYLFEALCTMGHGAQILNRLDDWQDMLALGLKTPMETPEPCRSDCHAWSSHPSFHFRASIAGIRPATPGFEKVVVRPQPGKLRFIYATIPHPRGSIEANLKFDASGGIRGSIRLPRGTNGDLVWRGKQRPMRAGLNRIG